VSYPYPPSTPQPPIPPDVNSTKILCGVMGIILGGLGVHRFILGDTPGGLWRILITVVTCGVGSLIGFVEGIIYLTKSDQDFYQTYMLGKKAWF
jgi:TM2 domain-containing membrane protein YozV